MSDFCDLRILYIDFITTERLFIHLYNELMRDREEQICFIISAIVATMIVSTLISIK